MAEVGEDDAARLRREREEAMERLLLQGEQQQEEEVEEADNGSHNGDQDHPRNERDMENDPNRDDNANEGEPDVVLPPQATSTKTGLSYTTTSFLLAWGTLWYAMRTREQWYLALVFLGGSKVAYCILGNAMIALCVVTFDYLTKLFLGGIRVLEAEGLQDFFRWNVTETCLALTMFRQELTITVAIQFLGLVLVKCLHHVAALREQHLRMTDDAVRGSAYDERFPVVPLHHVKVLIMLVVLQSADLVALQYTAEDLLTKGPSVSILFAFEAAILLVSAWSHMLLWYIHVADGLLHFLHDEHHHIGQILLHPWKEHKATLTFAVELQAQAVQFVFYCSFFGFVMTYYGMPINLFREVYVSFMALKQRVLAFLKYRRLMASMNRFATPSAEQLEEAGRVCIICRDEMNLHDCKALPGCGHIFHKSCLREWLTQQQTCPTCRSDITSMEARQAAAQAAQQRRPDGGAAPAEAAEEATERAATETISQHSQNNGQEDGQAESVEPTKERINAAASTPSSQLTNLSSRIPLRQGKMETSFHSRLEAAAASVATSPLMESKAGPGTLFQTTLTFPALYRVVQEQGAVVWNLENDLPSAIRRLPLGTIVFVHDMQQYLVDDGAQEFVRIPDGWVKDDSVLRIYDEFRI